MAKKIKEVEPQYFVSKTGLQTYNYNVYIMSFVEKTIYFMIAFAAGAAVGYLFFGGIGKDEFGRNTTLTWILNFIFCVSVGLAAGIMFVPIRTQQIINKKRNELKLQFRELLEAVSTSIGSGNNVMNSFSAAYKDLAVIYDEDAFIIQELKVIIDGFANNVPIEATLRDFAVRSGIVDIQNFADVFETCYGAGGDIKDVIKSTYDIISEKMEIEMDIATTITSSKTELTTMTFMPIVLIGLIKMSNPESASNYTTGAGIIATMVASVMFVAAYFVGRRVMDIKV